MEVDDCKEVPSSVYVAAPVCPVEELVEPGNDEELEAQEEEEQADVPLCLPTQYQPSHSEYLDHCVRTTLLGHGAVTASKDEAESLDMSVEMEPRMYELLLWNHLIMPSWAITEML